jgi:hypothetical protein
MLDLEFNKFDLGSEEGMLLLASISILTGNIDMSKYGSNKTPDEAFKHIQDLANRIFFEEEYRQKELEEKRNKIIDDIVNGKNKKTRIRKKNL